MSVEEHRSRDQGVHLVNLGWRDNKKNQTKGKNEVNLKDKTISYCFIILASSETRDSQILILHCDLSNSKQEPNMKVYYHCCSE